MTKPQSGQELKAERVQEELKAERVQEESLALVEEPFRISLKAERVQVPEAVVARPAAQSSSVFEMSLNVRRAQPVRIELTAQGTVITI